MIISCSLIIHTVDCMFSNAVLKPEEQRPWFLRCCSQFKIVCHILCGALLCMGVHSKTNAKAQSWFVAWCFLIRWQTPGFAAFFCQTSLLMCNDLKYFVLKKSDDCANDLCYDVSWALDCIYSLPPIYELRHISRINILSRTHPIPIPYCVSFI